MEKIENHLDWLDAKSKKKPTKELSRRVIKKAKDNYTSEIEKVDIRAITIFCNPYSATGLLNFKYSWNYVVNKRFCKRDIEEYLFPYTKERKTQTPKDKEIFFTELDLRKSGPLGGRFDDNLSDSALNNYMHNNSNMALSELYSENIKVAYNQKRVPDITLAEFKKVVNGWKDLIVSKRDRKMLYHAYFQTTKKTVEKEKYNKEINPCPEWYISQRMNKDFPDMPTDRMPMPKVLESREYAIEEWHYLYKKASKKIFNKTVEKNLSDKQGAKKMKLKLGTYKKALQRSRDKLRTRDLELYEQRKKRYAEYVEPDGDIYSDSFYY